MQPGTFLAISGGTGGVNPSLIPLEQLAAIRGDMWPAIGSPAARGPRQGSPDNILAMDYGEWETPATQAAMIAQYASRGWRHFVTGPAVDVDGYHGTYPTQPTIPTQAQWDAYLDWIQRCYDGHLIPIHFVHPDGWTIEQMDALAPLYQQPRAQRLLRIVIPTGWEPTRYDWKASYWRAIIDKVTSWFANAPAPVLYGIHTVADVDAPTGDGDNFPNGNAGAWEIVAPAIHFWLVQNGPYTTAPAQATAPLPGSFRDQFDVTVSGSLMQRFRRGYAGWPTGSAWGPTAPLRVINAECTAYSKFWSALPESAAIAWGDLAMQAGADGFLDGGTV